MEANKIESDKTTCPDSIHKFQLWITQFSLLEETLTGYLNGILLCRDWKSSWHLCVGWQEGCDESWEWRGLQMLWDTGGENPFCWRSACVSLSFCASVVPQAMVLKCRLQTGMASSLIWRIIVGCVILRQILQSQELIYRADAFGMLVCDSSLWVLPTIPSRVWGRW